MRLPTSVQAVFFTVLMPGTVVAVLPSLIYDPRRTVDIGAWRWLGWPLMAAGAAALLLSVAEFALRGNGTPAIFFTRGLRALVGEEPATLIRSALYTRVRNPMYVAVLAILCGETIWFESPALAFYFVVCAGIFHLTVVLLEEPHLRKRHPDTFPEYCRTTPRWIPKLLH